MSPRKTVTVLTLPAFAKALGIHRTTLLRHEQRGHIPEAPRVRGIGRVYDAKLQKDCREALEGHLLRDRKGKDGILEIESRMLEQ